MILWSYIKECMSRNPEKEITDGKVTMTYEELIAFSESFAEKISDEKCCAILCDYELYTAAAILSCFAADVTAIPLSIRYGELHYKRIIDTVSPSCIIKDKNAGLVIEHRDCVKYNPPIERPALIMFTSGTTGNPKGIMLSENNIITNLQDISDYFKICSNDSILIARPIYHCAVLTGEFLTALLKGLNIRFYSESFNPLCLINIISENNITVFGGTPTIIGIIVKLAKDKELSSLQNIVVSGESLCDTTAEIIQKAFIKANIYHVYGLTEASPRVSFLPPELFETYHDFVGFPLKSVQVKIMKNNKKASVNEDGMLWINGENIMMGYYNDSKLTNKVLQNRWLRTGDIACINENGMLKIKGRSDDMIIRAGMNIYPQEIEAALKTDPRTDDVFVYGVKDSDEVQRIVMKISGRYENIYEVKKKCIECLPPYQVPSFIELTNELPKNGSGKIIRQKTICNIIGIKKKK